MKDKEFDHVAYLKDPKTWDMWPLCPVKRSTPLMEFPWEMGIVCKGTTTVVALNLAIGWNKEQFDAAKKYEYSSIEEMVADGWIVD